MYSELPEKTSLNKCFINIKKKMKNSTGNFMSLILLQVALIKSLRVVKMAT